MLGRVLGAAASSQSAEASMYLADERVSKQRMRTRREQSDQQVEKSRRSESREMLCVYFYRQGKTLDSASSQHHVDPLTRRR